MQGVRCRHGVAALSAELALRVEIGAHTPNVLMAALSRSRRLDPPPPPTVLKWILRGHLKPPLNATIYIMFEVISIKFILSI